MNVLIGANASGKTAILESIAIGISAYLSAFKVLSPRRHSVAIGKSDVYLSPRERGVHDSNVLLSSSIPNYPCSITSELLIDGHHQQSTRTLEREDGRTKFSGANPLQGFVSNWEAQLQQGNESEHELVLPLMLYLSSARLWNEDNRASSTQIPQRWNAYDRCLDKKRGVLFGFSYIKKLRDIAREENGSAPFPVYTVVLDAVEQAMREELGAEGKIIFSDRYEELVQQKEDGTIIRFSALSDGYRNVIRIILDIAVRACVLNPFLRENALNMTPGIVLIDELDLSLHPNWQRSIIGILKAVFPSIQFICTTHSPFVVQSLAPGELITLGINDGVQYAGESIEDIASDVMHVQDVLWSKKKKKLHDKALAFFEQLKSADATQTQILLEELELFKGEYSDNPALIAFLESKYNRRIHELR